MVPVSVNADSSGLGYPERGMICGVGYCGPQIHDWYNDEDDVDSK